MNLFLKILGGLFLLFLVVFAGAAIYVSTLDANQFKGQIKSYFEEATNRQLTLDGPIALSVIPNLHLSISDVSISNPTQFEEETFVYVQRAEIGVALWPLLNKRLDISHITLEKPDISLIAPASGAPNWEFAQTPSDAKASATQGNTSAQAQQAPLSELKTGAINITNGSLRFEDRKAGQSISLDNLQFSLDGISATEHKQGSLSFNFSDQSQILELDSRFGLRLDAAASKISLEDMLTQYTYTIKSNNMAYEGRISGDFDIDLGQERIKLSDLYLEANEQILKGQGHINDFTQPKIGLSLNGENIVLDKLMPLASAQIEDGQPKEDNKQSQQSANEVIALPVDLLQALTIDAMLTLGSVQMDNIAAENVRMKIDGRNGVHKIEPLSFEVFGGSVSTTTTLDVSSYIPRYSLSGNISDMKASEMVMALIGDRYVEAIINANYDLSTEGNTVYALKQQLNGTASFTAGEGVIQKWQLSRLINQAVQFFETGSLGTVASEDFKFTSASATANVMNGLIQNEDLTIQAPRVVVEGGGEINLPKDNINYLVTPKLDLSASDGEEKIRSIGITVKGDLSSPKYNIDIGSVVKDRLQEKTGEVKDKIRSKIEERLGTDAGKTLENLLPF